MRHIPRSRRCPCAAAGAATLGVVLVLGLVAAATASAEGFRVFSDGPRTDYLDTSWGFYSGASRVELIVGSKFPIDTVIVRTGKNALRLAWTSAPGGDWALCAATLGWTASSLDGLDSLLFWMRPASAFPAAELPLVFLEDAANRRTTGKWPLSQSVSAITPGEWQRVAVPVAFFRQNPGPADLGQINKVFFGQNPASAPGAARTVRVDDIRFVRADTVPPPAPAGAAARGFERHVDVTWDVPADPDHESVRVERLDGAVWRAVASVSAEDGVFADWLGQPGVSASYRQVAVDWAFNESTPATLPAATTRVLGDEEMLDLVQEAAFRYFWNHAHPVSGLARERYGSGNTCATGGTGFGVLAALAAIERGFVTRAQGLALVLDIADFYATQAESFHGAFPHWVHGVTGAHLPFNGPSDDTADIVETAYLVQGLLAARQYFDGVAPDEAQLRALVTQIWENVEWDAFRPAGSSAIYWHRSPTTGFSTSIPVQGWNECMILYLLATASPTHPVPASAYHDGWARGGAMRNGGSFYGHVLDVGPNYGGPLFFAHYSFLGFDPRCKRDAYANYFMHNRNHTLVNRDYCVANPLGRVGYGAQAWGLTASDDPWGYGAHAPYANDNGTLTPSAALSSMPYAPQEAMAALRGLYELHGARLWGGFGFKDAVHPGTGWVADGWIAIDQGPIVGMIENFRSGLLWSRFMANPEIAPALTALGFVPDSATVTGVPAPRGASGLRLAASPNPSVGAAGFLLDLPSAAGGALEVAVEVFDLRGRRVAAPFRGALAPGRHALAWDGRGPGGAPLAAGLYLARVTAGAPGAASGLSTATARLLRLR